MERGQACCSLLRQPSSCIDCRTNTVEVENRSRGMPSRSSPVVYIYDLDDGVWGQYGCGHMLAHVHPLIHALLALYCRRCEEEEEQQRHQHERLR